MTRKRKDAAAPVVETRPPAFALGDPGAVLRLEYPLQTRSEKRWGLVLGVIFVACGAVLMPRPDHPGPFWFAIGCVAVGAVIFALQLRPRSGRLVLGADHLEIGPVGSPRRIPLVRVTGFSRADGDPAAGLEQLVVMYREAAAKPKVGLGVALLPRSSADEIEARILLRARAAAIEDPRAVEAVEALHLAGGEGIGVLWDRGAWRPFGSSADLSVQLAQHPFRAGGKSPKPVPVCVPARVWAVMETSDAFAGAVEPLIVQDRSSAIAGKERA